MNLLQILDPLLHLKHVTDNRHPRLESYHRWLVDVPIQMVDVQPKIQSTIYLSTIDRPSRHMFFLQPF